MVPVAVAPAAVFVRTAAPATSAGMAAPAATPAPSATEPLRVIGVICLPSPGSDASL